MIKFKQMFEKGVTDMTHNKLGIIATLNTREFGGTTWTKEVSIVSWNGNAPKIDIREWGDNGKMSKGVTLTENEAEALVNALGAWLTERGNK